MSEGFIQRTPITLANSSGGYRGIPTKVGTLLASATNYIRLDVDKHVSKVDWVISYDKAATLAFFFAETNVTGCTIKLDDAKAIEDTDAFDFNGLTFIAETTEAHAVASERKFYAPSQAVAAANLATLLADSTYGVPGIGSIAVTAPTTYDLLTIAGGSASCYQLKKGSGDADEFILAETTLASLIKDNDTPSVTDTTAAGNSTKGGTKVGQWTDGAPYVYLGITNNAASDAMTYSVKAVRHWS